MFTHHEQMLLQETERRLALAIEARPGRALATSRRAKRAGWRARRQAPARVSQPEQRAPARAAGTLAAWGTSAKSAP